MCYQLAGLLSFFLFFFYLVCLFNRQFHVQCHISCHEMKWFLLDWNEHMSSCIIEHKYIAVYSWYSGKLLFALEGWGGDKRISLGVKSTHPMTHNRYTEDQHHPSEVCLQWDQCGIKPITHKGASATLPHLPLCWLLHVVIRVVLIWLCRGYFFQAVVSNAVRLCTEPVRHARPWAASTMTAASPAVPAVSTSSYTCLTNSFLLSHFFILPMDSS